MDGQFLGGLNAQSSFLFLISPSVLPIFPSFYVSASLFFICLALSVVLLLPSLNVLHKPLIDFLDRDIIYPTLQPWWTDTGMTFSDIIEYLSNVGDFGVNVFVPLGVIQDQMHSEKNIIKVTYFFAAASVIR